MCNLCEHVAADEVPFILQAYPVRESPAFDRIAENLGFASCDQNEASVLRLLMDNIWH